MNVPGAGAAAPAAALANHLRIRRPALFATEPLDPATALGALFALPTTEEAARQASRHVAESIARLAGPLAPAFELLPPLERERASILGAWIEALFVTSAEGDRVERRIERINRSAFVVARALGGESVASPFAQRFAAQSRRRELPRRALDQLLAEARAAVKRPLGATPEDWEFRSGGVAAAVAHALVGEEPSPSTVEAATAFARLVRLARVRAGGSAGFELPIEAPPTLTGEPPKVAMLAAVAEECEAIHPLLLRGARSVGEVPLTFRATLAALLELSIRLLGRIESHADQLLAGRIRLGPVERYWVLRRARRERFA